MPLANVISLQSGTNFTINVAAAQLSAEVTEKDFTVLHNGTGVSNVNYNKTTPTTLQYVGASLPSTTIEIRRKTSFDQTENLVTYANRFSSAKWNESLLRIQRWEEEVDLNGAGAIGAGVIPLPANDAYGAIWTNDTIYPPTRKVVWDKIETLAGKASPTFTGVPLAPTAAFANNTTQIATTAHVKNVLGNAPAITNPTVSNGAFTSSTLTTPAIIGGTITNATITTPTISSPFSVPTPVITADDGQAANTEWVIDKFLAMLGLAESGTAFRFRVQPNLLVQAGTAVVTANVNGDIGVTYPVPFTVHFGTLASLYSQNGTYTFFLTGDLNTTAFSGRITPVVNGGNFRINYIAFGKP